MKKIIYVPAIIFFTLSSVISEDMVDIYGYFESQVAGAEIKKNIYQLYTNKLRMDVRSDPSENITFAANFNYITYHGKTSWNILDYLLPGVVSAAPRNMEQYYTFSFSDHTFLDNAYLMIRMKYLDLITGKQQISLGTGYVWNPTDVFNIKDILDPAYEQPGHNAIRIDIPIGLRYNITAIYSPDESWKNSTKMVRFKGKISHFDYSLITIEKLWRFHDYTQLDTLRLNFFELPVKRKLAGGSLVGELLGLGIWAEYGYNWMRNSKDFYELVIGSDYTFDFQTYIMIEYYGNTLAKTNYRQYNLNDWMRFYASEQKAISRDQLYCLVEHPVTDFMALGISTIISISDNSIALVPTVNYSFAENVEITGYINFNLGKKGTAYGENTGNGALLRARVYF
jgi:hypothetical protein